MRQRLTVFVTALLLVAAGYLFGQATPPKKPEMKVFTEPAQPKKPDVMILQSPQAAGVQELGFRVTKLRGDHAYGTLVAKINGQWVPVDLDGHATFASH
jgi:hypothetical protein